MATNPNRPQRSAAEIQTQRSTEPDAETQEAQRRAAREASGMTEAEANSTPDPDKPLDVAPAPGGRYLLDDKKTWVNAHGQVLDPNNDFKPVTERPTEPATDARTTL